MKNDDSADLRVSTLGRRDLMKLGAGAGVVAMTQMLNPQMAKALAAPKAMALGEDSASESADVIAETGAGWKNTSGRAYGNGPMDDTSRQIVEYVSSFSESMLTDSLAESVANVLIDGMSSLMAGFESDPARICARMARSSYPAGNLKSTILGYGITTTPEMAAYANTGMLRHTDFNDDAPGGHVSDLIPGVLAIGEALHSTGSEVLIAVTLGYEMMGSLGDAGGDDHGLDSWPFAPAVAMAAGKLLKLNEDQLANALSLAIVPRVPLRVNRTGTLSMAKGWSSAPAIRDGVFSALLAREGMTGACQPFEARDGLWDRITGPFKDLRLPAGPTTSTGLEASGKPDGRLCVQRASFKGVPAESQTHALLEVIPQFREWTKADDIASIHIEGYEHMMMEIGDPPKWDPRNRETADHSLPYVMSRALIDGQIYLDSFTPEKITDPAVRQLMDKITISVNNDFPRARQRMTVRTKSGGELVKDVTSAAPLTHEEMIAKYKRVCAYRHVADGQRDHALAQWSDLRSVKDFADAMQTLAKFGRPLPL